MTSYILQPIRKNFVAAASSGLDGSPDGFDTGIGLESADGAEVCHNTIVSTFAPVSSSIEWRWDLTTAVIMNNLTSHALLERDDASATLDGNISTAPLEWFSDSSVGDLHLVADDLAPVGVATVLAPGLADDDFDGLERDTAPDVGADEYGYPVFIDGFELGDTSRWSTVVPLSGLYGS